MFPTAIDAPKKSCASALPRTPFDAWVRYWFPATRSPEPDPYSTFTAPSVLVRVAWRGEAGRLPGRPDDEIGRASSPEVAGAQRPAEVVAWLRCASDPLAVLVPELAAARTQPGAGPVEDVHHTDVVARTVEACRDGLLGDPDGKVGRGALSKVRGPQLAAEAVALLGEPRDAVTVLAPHLVAGRRQPCPRAEENLDHPGVRNPVGLQVLAPDPDREVSLTVAVEVPGRELTAEAVSALDLVDDPGGVLGPGLHPSGPPVQRSVHDVDDSTRGGMVERHTQGEVCRAIVVEVAVRDAGAEEVESLGDAADLVPPLFAFGAALHRGRHGRERERGDRRDRSDRKQYPHGTQRWRPRAQRSRP